MAQGPDPPGRDVDASPEAIRARMRQTRAGLARNLDALKSRLFDAQGPSSQGTKPTMPPKKASKKSASSRAGDQPTAGKKVKAAAKKPASSRAAESTASQKPARAAKSDAKPKSARSSKSAASPTSDRTTKSRSGARPKSTRKRGTGSIGPKAAEVLGQMATGAVVGAVTGAADRVSDQPTAVKKPGAKRTPSSRAAKSDASKPTARKRGTGPKAAEVLGQMAAGAAIGAVTGAAQAVAPAEEPKEGQTGGTQQASE